MSVSHPLDFTPAVAAFDAVAERFDERFGSWGSVAAQRRAVRRLLLDAFPPGACVLEVGGGTGEDALFLAGEGRHVFLTDGSPRMVARARAKVERAGFAARVRAESASIEGLGILADERDAAGAPPFSGAFSNFAAFNCVEDLPAAGRALARLLAPASRCLLVIFGPFSIGEMFVLAARGEWRAAFRRLSRRPVPASLGGRAFTVRYPSPREVARAFAPWFTLEAVRGIGVFVPPSSAEPSVSRFPRLLRALEALDRIAARPLALLGDHVLLDLVRRDGVDPRAC